MDDMGIAFKVGLVTLVIVVAYFNFWVGAAIAVVAGIVLLGRLMMRLGG